MPLHLSAPSRRDTHCRAFPALGPIVLASLAAGFAACSSSSTDTITPPGLGELPDQYLVVSTLENGSSQYEARVIGIDVPFERRLTDDIFLDGLRPGGISVSPLGTHMTAATAVDVRGFLFLIDLSTAEAVPLLYEREGASAGTPWTSWSPGGNRFAATTPVFINVSTGSNLDSYLCSPDVAILERLNSESSVVGVRAWAEDSSAFVAQKIDGSVVLDSSFVVHLPNATELHTLQDSLNTAVGPLEWSQDFMAYTVADTFNSFPVQALYQYDEAQNNSERISSPNASIEDFSYSPDGQRILQVIRTVGNLEEARLGLSTQGDIHTVQFMVLVDTLGEIELRPWSPGGEYFSFVHTALSPASGERLTISSGGPQFQVPLVDTAPPGSTVTALQWSPDGRYLAFASNHEALLERALYLFDTQGTGNPMRIDSPSGNGSFSETAFSQDSSYLYAVFLNQGTRELLEVPLANPASATTVGSGLTQPQTGGSYLHPVPDGAGVVWIEANGNGQTLQYHHPSDGDRPLLTTGTVDVLELR